MIKKISAAILALLIIVALPACKGGVESRYRIVGKALASEEFALGFRQNDRLSAYFSAALLVLVADGTAADISRRWFGEDKLIMKGDAAALDGISADISGREIIVGVDPGSPPMSYMENGEYYGFDIDLCRKVGEFLGIKLTFAPIKGTDILIELNSGNVDCVWGAMSFDAVASKLNVSAPYMKSEKVLVVLADSGVSSLKDLKRGSLATTFDDVSLAAIRNTKDFPELYSLKTFSTAGECFLSLEQGDSDAILIDRFTLDYLG